MLSWLPRRRARIERIDAEAEALIRTFRDGAYSEARRREHEASSDEIAKDWSRVALAIAHKMGGRVGVDPSTRIAMGALLVPDREPVASRPRASRSALSQVDQLDRILGARPPPFRIQFVGSASDCGSSILKEIEIQASNLSASIVAAAIVAWPPGTIGLRILDREGREVFGRQKADRR